MLDLFKKSMLTGIGLALKTWDEVEALGKELEEKGKMPREEAKKFIEELQKRYEETQAKLEERVEKSVRDFLGAARTHAPRILKNKESGSCRLLNLKVYSDKYAPKYLAATPWCVPSNQLLALEMNL